MDKYPQPPPESAEAELFGARGTILAGETRCVGDLLVNECEILVVTDAGSASGFYLWYGCWKWTSFHILGLVDACRRSRVFR